MGPVTMFLSDKPITQKPVKSMVANVATKRRCPDLRGVKETVRSCSNSGSPSSQFVGGITSTVNLCPSCHLEFPAYHHGLKYSATIFLLKFMNDISVYHYKNTY